MSVKRGFTVTKTPDAILQARKHFLHTISIVIIHLLCHTVHLDNRNALAGIFDLLISQFVSIVLIQIEIFTFH